MIGVLIILIGGLWSLLVSGDDAATVFSNSATSAMWWYIAASPFIFAVFLAYARKIDIRFPLGKVLIIFIILRAMLVGGAWLIAWSLTDVMTPLAWAAFIGGALLVLVSALRGNLKISGSTRRTKKGGGYNETKTFTWEVNLNV